MQADVFKKIDVLVEMAGASSNVDTLKAELKEIESETHDKADELTSFRELKEDEKYFRVSEKQVDENIKVSLESKIKKQEKAIRKLQKQIDSAVQEEAMLHNDISKLKEEIRLSKEYIGVLTDRISTVKDSATNDYYKKLLNEENQKLEELVKTLHQVEDDDNGALERLNLLNLAMEEMNSTLESEKNKLAETKATLVNPTAYIDEDLRQLDEDRIVGIQKKLADLDKRRLEIITDPGMIASAAKEALIDEKNKEALSKIRELVTIVKSKPYMDIPSSNELTAMLQEEEEAAIEERDEFAALIDSKDYSDGDSSVIEERINYLNSEIASLEEKIRDAQEEIKNIDTVMFPELTLHLTNTMNIYKQLEGELEEYKVIIETENDDKTPKRRAILAAAYDRKQKELGNVLKIVNNYKEDQKILINKAYILETQEISKYEEEIAGHKKEIVQMNNLLLDLNKAKDVLAIENDKQKLKELDSAVKNIKHRQKYSQTPDEIYNEIEASLGSSTLYSSNFKDQKEEVEKEEAPTVEPSNSILEETVMNELPIFPEDSLDSFNVESVEPLVVDDKMPEENSFIIGDYKEEPSASTES